EEIERGAFREDLYYRLNVMHLDVPPLRERPHDVAPLVSHFLEMFSRQYNLSPAVISGEALAALEAYDWPGNVRELRNVVERTLVRRTDGRITESDLPDDVMKRARSRPAAAPSTADQLFTQMTEGGESFWSVVFAPFQARDLTRADVREILRRGLNQSWGSYRGLLPLFNLEERDYRPFMRALRKHECHLPFQPFRAQHRHAARTRSNALRNQALGGTRS
ncbi:MAG: hypothetical protein AB7F99_12965, partial [Vicinamibacterales bacterium]